VYKESVGNSAEQKSKTFTLSNVPLPGCSLICHYPPPICPQ